jgi:hypothetical protein
MYQLDGAANAIFFRGGVPLGASGTLESPCSTLRLVPITLDSCVGDSDGDLDLETLMCAGGDGVARMVKGTFDTG